MSKGIAGYAARYGRSLSLVVVAIGIGMIGAYVTYPYSSVERAMLAKIGHSAAAAGLASGWFGSPMGPDNPY